MTGPPPGLPLLFGVLVPVPIVSVASRESQLATTAMPASTPASRR
jgi:hypothetical protein